MRQALLAVMRGSGRLERVLMFLGLFLISIYIGNRVYSTLYSYSQVQRFWADQESAQYRMEPRSPARNVTPDFRLWSGKRIKAYQARLIANVPPLGVLQISALKLKVPVLEGTDDLTLDRAVGHIAGTPSPGELGNIGIAGHRDGFFRGLKDLRRGETIVLYHRYGNSRYLVDGIQIVPPSDVSVLAPQAKSSLTLVTCYPFYFIGSAHLRYIVHATVIDANGLKSPGQPLLQAQNQAGAVTN